MALDTYLSSFDPSQSPACADRNSLLCHGKSLQWSPIALLWNPVTLSMLLSRLVAAKTVVLWVLNNDLERTEMIWRLGSLSYFSMFAISYFSEKLLFPPSLLAATQKPILSTLLLLYYVCTTSKPCYQQKTKYTGTNQLAAGNICITAYEYKFAPLLHSTFNQIHPARCVSISKHSRRNALGKYIRYN